MKLDDFRKLHVESPDAVWELSKTELIEALIEAVTPRGPIVIDKPFDTEEEKESWYTWGLGKNMSSVPPHPGNTGLGGRVIGNPDPDGTVGEMKRQNPFIGYDALKPMTGAPIPGIGNTGFWAMWEALIQQRLDKLKTKRGE